MGLETAQPQHRPSPRPQPNALVRTQRLGKATNSNAADYAAGDIVAWKLAGSGLLHIGIVSDRKARNGTPLIIHKIGSGTQEEDLLFKHTIIGHYRPKLRVQEY